ncbi:retrotransposon-related protein [Tanacetum coccineum]
MESMMQLITRLADSLTALENRVNNGEGPSQRRECVGQNRGSYGRLTKVEFPRFEGDDVQGWLYRVNKFVEMDHIVDDEQKIRLVSMHVFGKALNWHKHFMSKFGEVVTWEVYQIQVKKRFESVFEDPVVELKNLKQTINVQVYQDSFEELLNKVELSEAYAVSLFIGGLKESIA